MIGCRDQKTPVARASALVIYVGQTGFHSHSKIGDFFKCWDGKVVDFRESLFIFGVK